MSWVTVIWSMVASACFTLAAMHFVVWSRRQTSWAELCFFLSATGTAAFAGCELWMMHARTPEEWALAMQWAHVPAWVLIVSLVAFVRLYMNAGRPWLGWTVVGVRTLSLALNFIFPPNLNYREVTGLRHVLLLGEYVSIPEGVHNPLMLVGNLSFLVLVIFVAEAALAVWRRGDRRRALVVGGSILFFTVAGPGQAAMALWGFVDTPVIGSLFYLGLVAVMGYELSQDVLRAAWLADELQESQTGMRLAAAAAKLALWTWDIPGDRIWTTPEGRPFYGVAQGEKVSLERFLLTVHPADQSLVRRAVQSSLSGDGEYDAEYRVVLPDGTVRWISARGMAEFGRDGEPRLMRGVSLDVTERKLAEQDAQLQRNEVAHLSRVTTLGEISGSLAHELNQPLGAILANTEAAELHLQSESPNLDEVRAILADIHKDDLRASEIIHGIRAFLGRRELDNQPVDVAELATDTVRLIGGDAATRNVTISITIPPTLPRVTGDRVHLQQVLLNLVVNGMDAMTDCPVADRHMAIRAAVLDPRTVELAVSDAGVGIPPEDLTRVFDPFQTSKPGGLGLGLAICRSIVEAHGGSISIESNQGGGSTARVSLPSCEECPS